MVLLFIAWVFIAWLFMAWLFMACHHLVPLALSIYDLLLFPTYIHSCIYVSGNDPTSVVVRP